MIAFPGTYLMRSTSFTTSRWASNAQQDYFKIHMEKALITSMQISGSSENPMESISFAFGKIKVSYNPEEGGSLKGFIDKGFDVLKLKQW